MFNDIGALELVTIVVLGILIFGPDKLPKVVQDITGFIRKIRAFSDSAKHDIRSELGPEFKDFEFEDLNPKTFIRKQLSENEDLRDIRSSFDLRKELNEVTDAVNSREPEAAPDLLKKPAAPAVERRTWSDADAT
ncbi:Sec-independent protein translocase subunit TatB [Streptomyces sp. BR123]|uniref:sec-independent translocase n=1 Tax=Streptomyces sp. BR123 TaxID=2749828 RepID=UPI0015C42347|nr:sec-independent translocase [Streptomyces sp. BR123]NXY96151.1 Sec-independent protein translocase subunit TatB [Streptomyces sp. BR123]